LADICAKSANLTGIQTNNLVSFKEVISSFNKGYEMINFTFIDNISEDTGAYYTNNFRGINTRFIEKLAYKRREYTILIRMVIGYGNTNNRLFKMGLIDSPACNCDFVPQDLNHFFGDCPFLRIQRKKLYRLLRQRNLQDPFLIEYLLGNLDKITATIICRFVLKIENVLNIRI